MADTKISALPASTVPLAGTEVLPIVQSSTTKQVSVANLTAGRTFDALGMTLTSTDAGANEAPTLDLYRDSASPTAADTLAEIQFNGEDSAGNKQKYACIHGSILSPTSTAEAGQLHFETATGGASTEKMIIGTTNLVINEIGAVFNVRIEGDTDANLFYTDATNSRIGVGTITPSQKLSVQTAAGGAWISSGDSVNSASPTLIGSDGTGAAAVYTQGAYSINFTTNNTEKVRIASDGNVGIGTNNPSFLLHLSKTTNASSQAYNVNTNAGTSVFTGYVASTDKNETAFRAYGSGFNSFTHAGISLANWTELYAATASSTGPAGMLIGVDSASPIVFATTNTERARIDSSGSLLVGITSASNNTFQKDSGSYILSVGSTNNTPDYISFYNNNGVVGSVGRNAGTGVVYNTTSDQRLKTNIVDAPSGNINDIKVRSFDWIVDQSHQEYGMVAQELIEVAPYAVTKPANPDDMMQVDYSKLVPMMIKEIQELKQRITALENK
jgi:hypothetical protein